LSLVPATSRADEVPEARRTVVMAQPLYGLSGQFGASVERAVSEHVALAATVEGTLVLDEGAVFGGWRQSLRRLGAGLEPGVHFYLTGRAPEGFWVGPHLEASVFQHRSVSKGAPSEGAPGTTLTSAWRTFEYGGSVRAGYTAILSPGLSVQVGLGLVALARNMKSTSNSVRLPDGTPTTSESNDDGWWVGPRMSLGVGWAF
jgi:hypothetical protein